MMDSMQIEALKTAVRYLADSEYSHFVSEGEPADHIYRTVMTLNHFLDGDKNQADNGVPTQRPFRPTGIAQDNPSHGEERQGPSVIDRGKKEIETRWAKEAIGLIAVELNEAYAQFEIGRNGCDIPSPYLHRATARLVEVMRRLALAEYREVDSLIPF